MIPRPSVGAVLASALRKVVGGRLQQSNLGEVWREDRTWLELAQQIDAALRGKIVLVDKADHERLVADANQFHVIRKYIEEYKALLPKDKKAEASGRRNPYIRWLDENMPPKET